MISHMPPRSLPVALFSLLASLPALLPAQETTGIEDERMQELMARNAAAEQWFGPRNKVSAGFRLLSSGGNVEFGNLGAVPARAFVPASAGNVTRTYDDGEVQADGLRSSEIDINGNQISTPGGRYGVYATLDDGTRLQVADFLSYTPGLTRAWGAANEEQVTSRPGYVAMSNYSTTSEGGSFIDKPGMSAGVELQFQRDLGRLSRRIQWGFMAGITLNGINSKSAGSVVSTLNSRTDYFAINIPPGLDFVPTSGPDLADYTDAYGNVRTEALEITVPVSQAPDESLTTTQAVAGGATVDGRWQVKGAYFMVKLGPAFRAQFNDRLELSGSAGYAGAYAGTTYTASESFKLDFLPEEAQIAVTDPQVSTITKYLSGFYADLTLEWNANERTGIFGGVTAQQLDAYVQKVADRTAKIDLGNTVGVRGGLSIRF